MLDEESRPDPFELFFRENYSWLCEVVYGYVRSQDIAQDIVQDLFLSLLQKRSTGSAPELTKAYLYAAARNHAFKYLRHQQVVQRFAEQARRSDTISVGTDHGVREREIAEAVDAALAGLPARCREIFLLSRRRHMSNAEIATVLGISIKTVEVQMWRALRTLRDRLAPYLALAVLVLR
jgi:RNA polymerase sigma-70 factor, ECF subfamily